MRPGQNKRMRNNRPTNNRRGPNPLTRSYESNGPDVKIRGNAHHVAEKYLQLARDAHTGGDPVAAENYLQHAEHYFRLIAAAQAAQAMAQSGQPRPDGDADDIDDDDDFGGLSDRFASPSERAGSQLPQHQPPFQPQPNAANAPQPYVDRPAFDPERANHGGDRQPFQNRQERQNGRFPDRNPRPDRPFADRTDGYRDNRNNRDQRGREFRPYREQREGGGEANAGGPGLPSFITSAPRSNVGEGELPPPTPVEPPQTPPDSDAGGNFGEAQGGDSRFPGRGRRRRLRSPYGFNVGQGGSDIQDAPPLKDDSPVNE